MIKTVFIRRYVKKIHINSFPVEKNVDVYGIIFTPLNLLIFTYEKEYNRV